MAPLNFDFRFVRAMLLILTPSFRDSCLAGRYYSMPSGAAPSAASGMGSARIVEGVGGVLEEDEAHNDVF